MADIDMEPVYEAAWLAINDVRNEGEQAARAAVDAVWPLIEAGWNKRREAE